MRARAQLPTDDAWRRTRVNGEFLPLFALGAAVRSRPTCSSSVSSGFAGDASGPAPFVGPELTVSSSLGKSMTAMAAPPSTDACADARKTATHAACAEPALRRIVANGPSSIGSHTREGQKRIRSPTTGLMMTNSSRAALVIPWIAGAVGSSALRRGRVCLLRRAERPGFDRAHWATRAALSEDASRVKHALASCVMLRSR